MTPYEIIAGPLELWLAPIGTAFPVLGAAPANTWTKVGTHGDRSYSEEGVQVMHNQTLQEVMTAGAMGAVKAFRASEALMFTVTMLDLSLEQYATALHGVAPTTVAAGVGTAGYKQIGLSRGEVVTTYALLARGPSAYADSMTAQFEVPRCYQSGNPNPVHRKGVPAGLALSFAALEDLAASSETERFGRLKHQHQAALSS